MKPMILVSLAILVSVYSRTSSVAAQSATPDSLLFPRSSQLDTVSVNDPNELNNFAVFQNYPNPFQNSTTVEFIIPSKSHVSLAMFDKYGRKVKTLVNYSSNKGRYRVIWDGRDATNTMVSPGIYYFEIASDRHLGVHRMLMTK